MPKNRYVHAGRAKHIPRAVRRDLLRRKRQALLLPLLLSLRAGPVGIAIVMAVMASPWVPNPRFSAARPTSKHESWLPYAEALPQDEFYNIFRMPSYAYAKRLARALNLPAEFRCGSAKYRCSGLEGLLLLHARLGTSGTWGKMAAQEPFSTNPSAAWSYAKMSSVFTHVAAWIDVQHGGTALWSNATFSPDRAPMFSERLQANGVPPTLASIIAFIDGTCRPCCRPQEGQRSLYNGWKKRHLIKYSCVVTPDGMIASCVGPFAGRRNDRYMFTASNIKQHFVANLPGWSLFGDSGYTEDIPFLFRPFPGRYPAGSPQHAFNLAMSKVRVSVEHPFGSVVALFPFLDLKKNAKIFLTPIGRLYRVGVLFHNCRNCVDSNQVSQAFDCQPVALEDYLNN